MRFFSFLSSLAFATLTAITTVVFAQSPLPTPQFEPLFAGQITITSGINTTSPFGTRVHYAISGWVSCIRVVVCCVVLPKYSCSSSSGNMTDAKTGDKVATILALADDGIVSNSGVFFPEAVIPVIWDVDGHLASIRVTGIG